MPPVAGLDVDDRAQTAPAQAHRRHLHRWAGSLPAGSKSCGRGMLARGRRRSGNRADLAGLTVGKRQLADDVRHGAVIGKLPSSRGQQAPVQAGCAVPSPRIDVKPSTSPAVWPGAAPNRTSLVGEPEQPWVGRSHSVCPPDRYRRVIGSVCDAPGRRRRRQRHAIAAVDSPARRSRVRTEVSDTAAMATVRSRPRRSRPCSPQAPACTICGGRVEPAMRAAARRPGGAGGRVSPTTSRRVPHEGSRITGPGVESRRVQQLARDFVAKPTRFSSVHHADGGAWRGGSASATSDLGACRIGRSFLLRLRTVGPRAGPGKASHARSEPVPSPRGELQ